MASGGTPRAGIPSSPPVRAAASGGTAPGPWGAVGGLLSAGGISPYMRETRVN